MRTLLSLLVAGLVAVALTPWVNTVGATTVHPSSNPQPHDLSKNKPTPPDDDPDTPESPEENVTVQSVSTHKDDGDTGDSSDTHPDRKKRK